jgi:phage major head subunit gpT-like protein
MSTYRSGPDYGLVTEKGLIGIFRQELETQKDAGWAMDIGMVSKSNQETETYRWLGMTPALRQWVGERHAKGVRVEALTITNQTFEATLEIGIDDIRRDKLGIIRTRIADLAKRANEHWEKLISSAIEDNTTGAAYDGQDFFDTDHSSGSSGTQVNAVSVTQVPELDVTTAAAPTVEEFRDALLGMIEHFYTFVDDQGEPINGGANEFLCMVPPKYMGAALGAVSNTLTNSGSTNTLANAGFKIKVVVNPRLTTLSAADQFCLFRTGQRVKPFILQTEVEPRTSVIGAGSEEEFKNRRWLFGVEACRAVGYGLWQSALRATFS